MRILSLLPAMARGGRVVLVASQLTNELNLGDLQSRRGAAAESHVVRYAKTKTAVRMLAAEAAAPGRAFAEQGVAVVACRGRGTEHPKSHSGGGQPPPLN